MARDRMETVQLLRDLRERETRMDLGAATHRVAAAEQALAGARAELAGHREPAGDVVTLLLHRTVMLGLQQAVEMAEAQLHAAREQLVHATEAWQRARADQRAVERLRERRTEAAEREAFLVEQRELDETAVLARGRSRS